MFLLCVAWLTAKPLVIVGARVTHRELETMWPVEFGFLGVEVGVRMKALYNIDNETFKYTWPAEDFGKLCKFLAAL